MKESILGEGQKELSLKIKVKKIICLAAAAVTVLLNTLFLLLRTDENHELMLFLNIFADIAFAWFSVAFFNLSLKPMISLMRLVGSPVQKHEILIDKISDKTVRVGEFDCYKLYAGERVFFLPDSANFSLKPGEAIISSTASNIITEVEYL